jgi:hypothetical protein
VLVYSIDAHPAKPDPSPYKGTPWTFKWSTLRQPKTYAARVANAQHISDYVKLNRKFTILVDDLAPHNTSAGNDPLWCGWGPAPNAAWLIARNSTVQLAQTWFKKEPMANAIAALLAEVVA